MIVLGIETSCDETAVAVIKKETDKISILSNIVSSQIALHAAWGGVVPNLAAREYLKNIIPVLKSALKEAQINSNDIDLISVTQGPGLIPALLIGTNFAKSLSYVWQKPLLGVHHIEGHIYANWIGVNSKSQAPISKKESKGVSTKLQAPLSKSKSKEEIKFPALALVVSGGHTQLILVKDHFQYEIVGETQDDAVGEAFDKVARLLGLGYPGGPVISAQADNFKFQMTNDKSNPNDLISNNKQPSRKNKDQKKYILPRPMLHSGNFDFSFSGLKTAVLYAIKKFRQENNLAETDTLPQDFIQEIAYEFQQAATDVLISKTIKAAVQHQVQTIFLAGGVSANQSLRDKLGLAVEKNIPEVNYVLQPIDYSTDNATMIAVAGAYRFEKMNSLEKQELLNTWQTLQADAQLILK